MQNLRRVLFATVLVASAACGRNDTETSPAGVTDVSATAAETTCSPLATLQAVNMPTKTAGADNGGYWNLYANGYLGQSVSFPVSGSYDFVVSARATIVRSVGAVMEIDVDGTKVGSVEVRASGWTDYTLTGNVSAGAHDVHIAFTNDAAYSRTEDRNLNVQALAIAPSSCDMGGETCDPIADYAAIDAATKTVGADQGGYWNLWTNGYVEQSVTFPSGGAYAITVNAEADLYQGVGANMQLLIDQQVAGSVTVSATTWADYTFTTNVSAGAHLIAVAFTNDDGGAGGDRNLLLQTISVAAAGCDSTVTPPPASDKMTIAIGQNTPGNNFVWPLGVPESYSWYNGDDHAGNWAPPPSGFTAMTGWSVIYPQKFAAENTSSTARIEVANFKTYVHLIGGGWQLVQQESDGIAGAFFVADFVANTGIPWIEDVVSPTEVSIGVPPDGYVAHFWVGPRGTYAPGTVDGCFVRLDARTTEGATNVVLQVGADWWQSASAPFMADHSTNPGIGGTNWNKLTTDWTSVYFFSSSVAQFEADPAPFD